MTNQNQPRKNKTKEELVEDLNRAKEIERQKVLLSTTVFPSLHDSCKTIADTKALLEFASSMVQKMGLEKMYETMTSELKLVEMMKDTETANKYKVFFSSFDTLTIGQCLTILDQLKRGVNNFVENKVDMSPLSDVNIEELLEKSITK